jgi:hypothetical protein
VRRVVEYINDSLTIRGTQSEYKEGAAVEDHAPVERPEPKEPEAVEQAHRRRHPWADISQ